MNELKNYILNELSPNGKWWDDDHAKPFILLAEKLFDNGESIDEIKDQLSSLYYAVANEFGS